MRRSITHRESEAMCNHYQPCNCNADPIGTGVRNIGSGLLYLLGLWFLFWIVFFVTGTSSFSFVLGLVAVAFVARWLYTGRRPFSRSN